MMELKSIAAGGANFDWTNHIHIQQLRSFFDFFPLDECFVPDDVTMESQRKRVLESNMVDARNRTLSGRVVNRSSRSSSLMSSRFSALPEACLSLLCMALCHNVVVDERTSRDVSTSKSKQSHTSKTEDSYSNKATSTTNIQYRAESPDEKSLVEAAAKVGVVFCGRDRNGVHLNVDSKEHV